MKELHELISDKLEQSDSAARTVLLSIPLDNIDRWLANGHTAPHRLERWRQILQQAQESPSGFCRVAAPPPRWQRARSAAEGLRPFCRCAHAGRASPSPPRMRLQFLTHLLSCVSALAQPRRIIVLGSSSLLPQHPQLGDAGQPLELSLDADLLVERLGSPVPRRLNKRRK